MVSTTDVGVFVTKHAVLRAKQRGIAPPLLDDRERAAWIFRTVHEALRADRLAKNVPRWCAGEGRRRQKGMGAQRYAWDEAETAVFVLAKQNSYRDEFRVKWTVVTVYQRRNPDGTMHRPH